MMVLKVMVELNVVGVMLHARFDLDLLPIEGMISNGTIVVHIVISRRVYVVMTSTIEARGVRVWEGWIQ